VANTRTIGAALGVIIPTIITHHIAKVSAKAVGVQGAVIGMTMSTILSVAMSDIP
jgi:hypothetical protein